MPHSLHLLVLFEPRVERVTFLVAQGLTAPGILGVSAVTPRRSEDGDDVWKPAGDPFCKVAEVLVKRIEVAARSGVGRKGTTAGTHRELVGGLVINHSHLVHANSCGGKSRFQATLPKSLVVRGVDPSFNGVPSPGTIHDSDDRTHIDGPDRLEKRLVGLALLGRVTHPDADDADDAIHR
jgi:hypothetical protein